MVMLWSSTRGCALVLGLLVCSASFTWCQDQLSAAWIPTDLNYAMISRLRNNDPLQNLTSQIAGYSTLGVITNEDVANFLQLLRTNPNARDATIRWQPDVAAKCVSGVKGCTKSVKITVLEWQYVDETGADCQANALVAVDAILPPAAIISDTSSGQATPFMPRGNPITYQVTKAPNATAESCTYVVQYPPPTQALANTLCTQGPNSCTDSPCVPCNANQTLTGGGPDPANDCTASNGLAPALVAAIQGAAQCLSAGPLQGGRFQCQVGFVSNNSACSQLGCFPGDATVMLEGGRSRRMDKLEIGDRVQILKEDGSLSYDDVYFFGHREEATVSPFVRLSLQTRSDSSGRVTKTLDLTSHHFVYAQRKPATERFTAVRAKDVRVGDILRVSHAEKVLEAEVLSVESVMKQGLWNPYTLSGRIVVDGVAVSAHSEWILDPIMDRLGLTHFLPALYQGMLGPVRLMYHVLGAQNMIRLDGSLKFEKLLNSMLVSLSGS